LAVVGSPDYFASHAKPSSPHDLPNHRCINLHGGSAGPYRWEFEKNADAVVVDVSGPLVVDDADLMIRAAVDGLGLTFSFEVYVAPQIVSGALVRVLEDWCSPFAGYFLYYPSRGSSQLRYRPSSRRFGYNSINRTSEAHPCRKTVHRSRWSSNLLNGSFFCPELTADIAREASWIKCCPVDGAESRIGDSAGIRATARERGIMEDFALQLSCTCFVTAPRHLSDRWRRTR
jgi:hypothetical protein